MDYNKLRTKFARVAPTCVCVCVFVPFIGGSPSVQGETCATLCSVSRGLHLFSVFFCPTRTNRGHTGGGKSTGPFFFFFCFFFLPHRPPAVLAVIFYREKGSAVPIPRQHQRRILSTHEAFSAINRFPLPGTKVWKRTPCIYPIRLNFGRGRWVQTVARYRSCRRHSWTLLTESAFLQTGGQRAQNQKRRND